MAKKGFFKKDVGEVIKEAREDCSECGLIDTCHTPHLSYTGKGKLGIAILYSHPEFDQDDTGELSCGKDYTFLTHALDDIGINLEEDCYYIPVLGCRTPRNRHPKKVEVGYCAPRLKRFLKRLDPNVVILLGSTPFDAIVHPRISGRLTGTPYNKFYGECIPDQELSVWICPMWSVEELMDTKEYDDGKRGKPLWERDRAVFNLWKDHLYNACSLYTRKVEVVDYVSLCKTTQDVDVALGWIAEAMSWGKVALDYETSGLKPHKKGHKITCASISNRNISYSFPFFKDETFKEAWKTLLLSSIKKIAHNMTYEYIWTKELEGYWFTECYFDTMLAAHCIYNNAPTGLKFCTYASFGVVGYDETADPYLKASDADIKLYGDNAFNRIDEIPMEDLLLYNALDSLFTYRLYERQDARLTEFMRSGFDMLMESVPTLAKCTQNGFVLNEEQFNIVTKELEEKIEQAEADVMSSDEVKQWDGDTKFNFNSAPQMSHLVYDILKVKPFSFTEAKKPSVDAETLLKIGLPFVRKIIRHRKLKKLLGTYINQYKTEVVDGVVHSWFKLNGVDTFRSSCTAVNIQNLPKRDEEAKQMITSLVLPRKGHKLISYDYKSLEVLINACHSGDQNLIAFSSDTTKDMHRSSAADIFMLEESEVTKRVRSGIKSAFVFSSFYGSYYKQTAPDCWELAQDEGLIDHLASKGINTYKQFENRVHIAEEILWTERFAVHDSWRKQQWRNYQKDGYLESFTGFRLQAPMSRNNSFNGCVQGDSYHIMQWALNQVCKELEEKKMDTYAWAEVHDAADFDCNPAEEEYLDYLVWKYFIIAVKEHWPWIVVNLQIEKEAGDVDANWSQLKTIGFVGENGMVV